MYIQPDKTNSQLVAHCFFSEGKTYYENYDSYYQELSEKDIIDIIESNNDY